MAQTCTNSYQTEKNKKKSEKSESMLSLLFPLQRQWCSLEDTTNTTAEKEDCTRMYVHFHEFLSDAIFNSFLSAQIFVPSTYEFEIFQK